MAYLNSFEYAGEEIAWIDDCNCAYLWELAEIGAEELFEYAGAEMPEEFDFDLFLCPSSIPLDEEEAE